MTVKVYDKCPPEAIKIREEVFIEEQGFRAEFDEIDDIAIHFVMYDDNDNAVAVCRAFTENNPEEYHLGRLAVKKSHRGQHLGEEIVHFTEEHIKSIGGKAMELSAQVRVADFYEKQGYKKYGDMYYDEYCPHIMMKKEL
ncbi:MAG: GNAT family N-acetyltransferase [Eubacterium sp.]